MSSVGQSVGDSFELMHLRGLLTCFHPPPFSLDSPKHPQTQPLSKATLDENRMKKEEELQIMILYFIIRVWPPWV